MESKIMSKIEKVGELTLDKLGEICEEEKVTVRSVCQLLYDGMNSMTIAKLNNDGEIIENSVQPDMGTRHKYMTSAMEILKLVKKEVPMTNVMFNNVSVINPEVAEKILQAMERGRGNIGQTGEIIDVGKYRE